MTDWTRPLASRYRRLAERLSLLPLADLPTPVSHLPRLSEEMGRSGLYVKRDDLSSSLYGGNKVRKLEFLLGDARRRGASTLVTMGGIGSNHLLATALHARSHDMRTVGVVFPQPVTEDVKRNLAADRGAGVTLVRIPSKYLLPVYVAGTLGALRIREGQMPVLIPGGGSSPLGALGFVNAALELAEQIQNGELPEPQAVFVALGTGGTAAGLALGLQLAGLKTRVVAVRVIDRLLANHTRLKSLLGSMANLIATLSDDIAVPAALGSNLEVLHGYIGPGYGVPTAQAKEAADTFQKEDIRLELTYTAKAAAAFLDRARTARGPLLFWNTYSSADISQWVFAGRRGHGRSDA